MKYLRGETKSLYQEVLRLVKNKDRAGLEKLSLGSGMSLARSVASTVLSSTSYYGDYYFWKEDELAEEFRELFEINGIEDKMV